MEIADRRVATVHFTLSEPDGGTIVTTHGHAPLVHMQGTGGIMPALEQGMEGKKAGDRFQLEVTPDRGFGPHFPQLVQTLPRSVFVGTQAPAVGDKLQAKTTTGTMEVVVTALDADQISVDGNHPLAGKTFLMDVEVVDVRVATPDEIQFGLAPIAT